MLAQTVKRLSWSGLLRSSTDLRGALNLFRSNISCQTLTRTRFLLPSHLSSCLTCTDARMLLDELMGKHRNAAPGEAKDVHWSDKDVRGPLPPFLFLSQSLQVPTLCLPRPRAIGPQLHACASAYILGRHRHRALFFCPLSVSDSRTSVIETIHMSPNVAFIRAFAHIRRS